MVVTKEYSKRAGMILRKYEGLVEFVCAICGEKKKSKAQAETEEGPACNGCYGQKVAEWDHYREQRNPTIHPDRPRDLGASAIHI